MEENKGGWTVDTLKEHFDKVLEDREKATNLAFAEAMKWRDNANEWRGAMNDREREFLTKSEFTAYKEAIDKALEVEKSRADINQGKSVGLNAFWGYLIGAIGLISVIINIVLNIL